MNITQQQEYRYQFAGMAMQAMINAIWSNPTTQDEVIGETKRKGYHSVAEYVADQAVNHAEALIVRLNEEE